MVHVIGIRYICIHTGCSKKKLAISNGYNFFNIHGRWIKQKLTKSWDFKFLLHLSIYFSNILLLATMEFRMPRLNSLMTRYRISTGIDSMIFLTCSFIWLIVAGIFSCDILSLRHFIFFNFSIKRKIVSTIIIHSIW